MIKVLTINLGNYGSTGGIVTEIKREGLKEGIEVKTCFPENTGENKALLRDDYIISKNLYRRINHKIAVYSGFLGCTSIGATKKMLNEITRYNPQIVHLHNLHGDYVNIPLLFSYLSKHRIYTIWTLHDCWAFTGRCPHFQLTKCEKWKTGCKKCKYFKNNYPESYIDRTRYLWKMKKKYFTALDNVIIVTPSDWLRKLVNDSYLNKYPIEVIYNGIDLNKFKPTYNSDIEKNINKGDRKIILGVSLGWKYSKGVDIFERLSQELDDKYLIVLVGMDKKQYQSMNFSSNVKVIDRTNNQQELAAIYTMADVFVNPTREEVFGLVNVEALACGTPVVTFNTGGCPEIVDDNCGKVIEIDDFDSMKEEIIRITDKNMFSVEACRKKAMHFDKEKLYKKYLKLYKKVVNNYEE